MKKIIEWLGGIFRKDSSQIYSFRKERTQMPTLKKLLLGLLPVVIVLGLFFFSLTSPQYQGEKVEKSFIVQNGESFYSVANHLKEEGLIRSEITFKIFARLFYPDGKLQPGSYRFHSKMNAYEMIDSIAKGVGKTFVKITIPEGYTVDQIAKLLESKGIITEAELFQNLAKTKKNPFLTGTPSEQVVYPVEGYLFPDTYHLYLERPAEEELMDAMLENFDQKTKELRNNIDPRLSLEDWVTLASLVEREVRKKEEQEVVVDIFWKRLSIGMPLQSCASIQYILGEQKYELTIADTQIVSPYNTYLHGGLTPGPVSNPGLPALVASAKPKDTQLLFFVAQADGSHLFSSTYEEHLQAIQKTNYFDMEKKE